MKDYILCAVDFSESSVSTLKWASKIANGTGAHLAVLFSYRLIQTGKVADILSFKRKTEEEAKRKFAALETTFASGFDTPRSFITEIGFFSDNIENFVRKNPSTMVVLGEELASTVYEHKGQSLAGFLKALQVPLLIVPQSQRQASVESSADREAAARKVPI